MTTTNIVSDDGDRNFYSVRHAQRRIRATEGAAASRIRQRISSAMSPSVKLKWSGELNFLQKTSANAPEGLFFTII